LAACVGDVLTEVIGLVPDASVVDGELVALVAVGPDGELWQDSSRLTPPPTNTRRGSRNRGS